MKQLQKTFNHGLVVSLAIGGLVVFAGAMSPSLAQDVSFAPHTRIRLTIGQWTPAAGEFKRWDMLGGEYTVSDDGFVLLPLLGPLSVDGLDSAGLTDKIAKSLQEKIGLLQPPAIAIEVIEYPPIYIVGDVTTPGEYKFRPGMTVLQGLAMSGGPSRPEAQTLSQSVKLAGEMGELEHSLLRTSARIARLKAEMAGSKDIAFEPSPSADQQSALEVFKQEQTIFQTRANALDRQSKALTELRALLGSEIDTLQQKLEGLEGSISSIEDQLSNVKSLVERGLSVSARQLDLERLLTSYRSDRLDVLTAIMRGRQTISETTRNLEGLYDTLRSEVASELQAQQASLAQLMIRRKTLQKLLLEELSPSSTLIDPDEERPLAFLVTRREKGEITEFPASVRTVLLPGDVLSAARSRPSANLAGAMPGPPATGFSDGADH